MTQIIVRSEAEADLTDAALWYEDRETGLGAELVTEAHAAIRRAAKDPLIHLQVRKRPEVRRILTQRFPYRVFYIVGDARVIVFAILHAARHDSNWRRRL